ncbi:PTS sugar transporter subunit IIA [Breznakia sp. OttesenSCG-928-G09]|nr:PTS sugar transporter subunit IIA [Breznakia sp. OttesenSCG-928-G09]
MEKVNLADVLVKEAFVLDHEPFHSKEEMFAFMASKFKEAGIIDDEAKYIVSLEEREAVGSTFMGNLIGLPHGKCEAVKKPGIGFCRCKEPFIYNSFGESGEVKYVFMLAISMDQGADHYMRVLAKLAGLLTHEEFIDILEHGKSYEEVMEMIQKYEK